MALASVSRASLFSSLSFEILVHVATFLELKDILHLRATCRLWHSVCQDSSLWKNIHSLDFLALLHHDNSLKISFDKLLEILKRTGLRLRSLSLPRFDDKHATRVLATCRQLRNLELRPLFRDVDGPLTIFSFRTIGGMCPNLESFSFASSTVGHVGVDDDDDEDVDGEGQNAPGVATWDCLLVLLTKCSKLKSLRVESMPGPLAFPQVDPQGGENAPRYALESLALKQCTLSEAEFPAFCHAFSTLRRLTLEDVSLSWNWNWNWQMMQQLGNNNAFSFSGRFLHLESLQIQNNGGLRTLDVSGLPHLRLLSAKNCPGLLSLLAGNCPSLSEISLENSLSLQSVTIETPLLQVLDLSGLVKLEVLNLACPILSAIDASYCESLTSDALESWLDPNTLPKLSDVDFSFCPGLTREFLTLFLESRDQQGNPLPLLSLALANDKIESLELKNPSLEDLKIYSAKLLSSVQFEFPSLKSLLIRNIMPSAQVSSLLSTSTSLISLEFEDVRALTTHDVSMFSNLLHLRELKLTNCNLKDLSLSRMPSLTTVSAKSCRHLHSIRIQDCPSLFHVNMDYSSVSILRVDAPRLVSLSFDSCKFDTFEVSSQELTILPEVSVLWKPGHVFRLDCPNMRSLKIGKSPHFNDSTCESILERCLSLQLFSISCCDLITSLSVSPSITALHLISLPKLCRIRNWSFSSADASPHRPHNSTEALNAVNALTVIHLHTLPKLPKEEIFRLLEQHSNWLEELSLRGMSHIFSLQLNFPLLESLAVDSMVLMSELSITCTSLKDFLLKGCIKLTKLSLVGVDLLQLKGVTIQASSLKVLSISRASLPTPSILASFTPHLREIEIEGAKGVDESFLIDLVNFLPELRTLVLENCVISEQLKSLSLPDRPDMLLVRRSSQEEPNAVPLKIQLMPRNVVYSVSIPLDLTVEDLKRRIHIQHGSEALVGLQSLYYQGAELSNSSPLSAYINPVSLHSSSSTNEPSSSVSSSIPLLRLLLRPNPLLSKRQDLVSLKSKEGDSSLSVNVLLKNAIFSKL